MKTQLAKAIIRLDTKRWSVGLQLITSQSDEYTFGNDENFFDAQAKAIRAAQVLEESLRETGWVVRVERT